MSALITYRNLADTATLTGDAEAGFPLDNLTTRQLSTRWAAAPAEPSPANIIIDLGAVKTISVVALLACVNIDYSTAIVDTSSDGVVWLGGYGITGSGDAGAPDLPRNAFFILAAPTPTRYIRVGLHRASGTPGDIVSAGRLWIGDALIIPYGADSDWTISTRERGTVDESEGGEIYPSAKRNGRELRMAFSVLDVAYAYGTEDGSSATNVPSFQDMHTHVGAIGEVIALPRSTGIWPRRVGIYGRLSDDSLSIRHAAGPCYSTSVRVIEER